MLFASFIVCALAGHVDDESLLQHKSHDRKVTRHVPTRCTDESGCHTPAVENPGMAKIMSSKSADAELETTSRTRTSRALDVERKVQSNVKCVNGMAGSYPCSGVHLQSSMALKDMSPKNKKPKTLEWDNHWINGGEDRKKKPKHRGNDIWGWTDDDGHEYVIFGTDSGTAFVDITNPTKPKALGFMPFEGEKSWWRDMKTYKGYVFVVSEAVDSGMQIFDLRHLRGLSKNKNRKFEPDVVYDEISTAHNVVINEDSGFAYLVGSKTSCKGGLHMVDIQDPTKPTFMACFGDDGFTHDAQCVNYKGPDDKYKGHEICFNYNEDSLTIVDVSDKSPELFGWIAQPAGTVQISKQTYPGATYTHQGWLTSDQKYLLMNDELDKAKDGTRTLIWDVTDLHHPKHLGDYTGKTKSIAHNLYIKGDLAFLSNYCDGLRVLDVRDIGSANLEEVGYFDVDPDCDQHKFRGTFSNYPFFPSGSVAVSSMERGLFVLQLDI